jgi:SNF2 family DNA or RNA helicase
MIHEVPLNFTPYQWQIQAFRKFVDNGLTGFALLADVGTGKTATAITLLRYLHRERRMVRVLVIGPTVVIHNWKNEIARYSHRETEDFGDLVYPLAEAKKRKEKAAELAKYKYPGIVITNYESFDNEEFVDGISKWMPQVIVCDELHRIKSYKSKRAKNIVKLGERTDFRLGLTGSAILNSPMDLFMQWKFIDGGESFGSNFFNFRNLYFRDVNAAWAGRQSYFPKWEPRPEMFDKLSQGIERSSIRVVKSECMDLPPFLEDTIKLEMTPKQKRAYDQMQKDFVAFVDAGGDQPVAVVAQLALTKALRLMQIASGFVQGDTGGVVELEDNPKLDALQKIIEDNESEKIIVWCSYKANYTAIGARLAKLKIPHVFLTGEQDAKEKQESIDAFQSNPDVRVIVANRKAGGIGVNLTAASISVVFSRNFSLEEEIQSDGRNYRGGSQVHERITKLNLVMEGTIEEQIIDALKNKQKISDVILDLKTF